MNSKAELILNPLHRLSFYLHNVFDSLFIIANSRPEEQEPLRILALKTMIKMQQIILILPTVANEYERYYSYAIAECKPENRFLRLNVSQMIMSDIETIDEITLIIVKMTEIVENAINLGCNISIFTYIELENFLQALWNFQDFVVPSLIYFNSTVNSSYGSKEF